MIQLGHEVNRLQVAIIEELAEVRAPERTVAPLDDPERYGSIENLRYASAAHT